MKIAINGFKNSFQVRDLGAKAFISGPNGSGKSAIMDGIRWAITGAVPTGKSKGEVELYCNQGTPVRFAKLYEGETEIALSTCVLDDSGKTKHSHKTQHEDFVLPLLGPSVLIAGSPQARLRWFRDAVGLAPLEVAPEHLAVQLAAQLCDHDHDAAVAVVKRARDLQSPVSVASARGFVSHFRDQRDEFAGAISKLPFGRAEGCKALLLEHAAKLTDESDASAWETVLDCAGALIRDRLEAQRRTMADSVAFWSEAQTAVEIREARELKERLDGFNAMLAKFCSTPIYVGVGDGGVRITAGNHNTSIEALSSGEQVLVLAVITAAISCYLAEHGDKRKRVIMCEADPCDQKNLGKVMIVFGTAKADLVCVSTWQMLSAAEAAVALGEGWTINLV